MTTSVLIPRQAERQKQSTRSDFSKIVETAAPIALQAVGTAYGGPAGGAAGAAVGKQFGAQMGDTLSPAKITGGGTETVGYQQADALTRRAQLQTQDPMTALKEAQAALAVRSPDEQKEYGPVLNQAILEARRQKGVMA